MSCNRNIKEYHLHPFFVSYAKYKFNCFCKTIKENESSREGAGVSLGVHPDIVGFRCDSDNYSQDVKQLFRLTKENIVTIYSFELKRKISTLSEFKSYYSQAIGNSIWANEGYLVCYAFDIKKDNELNEVKRMVELHGIGLIKLNISDFQKSEILFEAKRRNELDYTTIDKLCLNNGRFKSFIEIINAVIKETISESTLNSFFDPILSQNELESYLEINNCFGEKKTKKNNPKGDISTIDKKSNDSKKMLFEIGEITTANKTKIKTLVIKGEVVGNDLHWTEGMRIVFQYVCNNFSNETIEKYMTENDNYNIVKKEDSDKLNYKFLYRDYALNLHYTTDYKKDIIKNISNYFKLDIKVQIEETTKP